MNTFTFRAFSYRTKIPVVSLNDLIDYHDITFCLQGKLSYIINGIHYTLASGDCLYIPPNSTRVRLTDDTPTSYFSVNLLGPSKPMLSECFFVNALDKDLVQIIEWAKTAYNSRNYEKVVLLTQLIACNLQEKNERQHCNPTVWKIKNYILQNIEKKLTIAEIASHVCLSKEYCETLFKQETGKTIISFINSEKINEAKNMLLSDNCKLTTISETLGFEDYNYFSRVFKKYANITPIAFRKLYSP